jgi:hypothetical protein
MPKIAFVGLGAMGRAMAQRLLAAGHSVTGYNRTRAKAEALAAKGLAVADSARAAVEGASVVLSMVTDSEPHRDVALRPDGILAGLGHDAVWAEMSTVSPSVTPRAARKAQAGHTEGSVRKRRASPSLRTRHGRHSFRLRAGAAEISRHLRQRHRRVLSHVPISGRCKHAAELIVASWFETRKDALLTMRVKRRATCDDLILRSLRHQASRRMMPLTPKLP